MSSVDDTLSRPAQLGGVGVNRWVGGGHRGRGGWGLDVRGGDWKGGGTKECLIDWREYVQPMYQFLILFFFFFFCKYVTVEVKQILSQTFILILPQ